ncbi:MAG: alkaline phosphatase D family protein [Betaproteobacteria bacterium]|nr:alkaline phosphatase D family protein [Betaproteobacteria bacterium]
MPESDSAARSHWLSAQLARYEAEARERQRHAPHTARRHFLQSALALAAAQATVPLHSLAQAPSGVRFTTYPFTLGVASGAPRETSVVLWTRLATEPMAMAGDGGMGPERVAVRWEVAEDEGFKRIAQKGTIRAAAELGHSVRPEVTGLSPGRWYWYRFMAGDAVSPVGRTRTAPAVGAERLRFAFASCQQYEQGYFSAYRHMAKEDLDLVAFLGDYIYEANWGTKLVRRHAGPECETLAQYRVRYGQYRLDPDLAAMHAAAPWIVTWDDHEVANDYAADQSQHLDPRFLLRRAAAYQAFYEHMPLPMSALPRGADMKLYDRYAFGDLATFHVVDARQYRAPQACPRPGMGGSAFVEGCEAIKTPGRTMLGTAQEQWLLDGLGTSRARWNVLAQPTLMAQYDLKPGAGQRLWTDGWDGYPHARRQVTEFLAEKKIANTLVIGGDVHCHHVAEIKRDFDDPKSQVVASEFVGTSITSEGDAQEDHDQRRADNPHLLLSDGRHKGYVVMELGRARARADLRIIDNEKIRDSKVSTLASFNVDVDRPGPKRI